MCQIGVAFARLFGEETLEGEADPIPCQHKQNDQIMQ